MITSTSFYLSWSEPPPADQNGLIRQYLVNITELDTGSVFSYIATNTEFTAVFLHPYYYYTCSVSAVTVSAGPYSSSQTIRTEINGMCKAYSSSFLNVYNLHVYMYSYTVPSGPPQSTSTVALSSTSLLLMWDPPLPEQQNGPIVAYSVRLLRVDNDTTEQFDTNSTTITVDQLVPYTSYEWMVAAQTIAGTGPFSSPVIEPTLPDGKQFVTN